MITDQHGHAESTGSSDLEPELGHEHLRGKTPEIDPDLLLQQLRSGLQVIIVDVRESAEFKVGHIPTSRSIPMHRLGSAHSSVAMHHPISVVVVSRSGFRAHAAAGILALAGCSPISVLEGGINRWRELGHPIEDTSRPLDRAALNKALATPSNAPDPFEVSWPASLPPSKMR